MTDKEELAFQYQRGYTDGFLEGKKTFERPHGKWVQSKDGYTRCDQCGSRGSAIKARFCHHCGADMRPEKKLQTPSCLTNPERQAELLERYKEE